MPWKSEAERRLFHARPGLRKYIPEFNGESMKPYLSPDSRVGTMTLARDVAARVTAKKPGAPQPRLVGSKTLPRDVTAGLRGRPFGTNTPAPTRLPVAGKTPRPMTPSFRKRLVKQVRGL